MSFRGPTEEEPRSAPIYVRLGMTKGALIAFTVIVLAGIAGFIRLEQIAADQRATLRHVRAQQRQNLSALREVCRQGDTISGLIEPISRLLRYDVVHSAIPEQAIPIYIQALRVFEGYSLILRERPACREVLNP